MLRRTVVLALAATLATACAGDPREPSGGGPMPARGTVVSGEMAIGPRRIPLPPGSWRVISAGTDHARTDRGGGGIQTNIQNAVLVQERDGRAAGVILVQTAREVGVHWGPFGACLGDTIARDTVSAVEHNVDCQEVALHAAGRGPNTPPYLLPLYEEGERRPGWIPPRWLGVAYAISRRNDMLSLVYRFDPVVFAPSTAAGPTTWNAGTLTAEQQAFVDRLVAWMRRERGAVNAGFNGQPPAPPTSVP